MTVSNRYEETHHWVAQRSLHTVQEFLLALRMTKESEPDDAELIAILRQHAQRAADNVNRASLNAERAA